MVEIKPEVPCGHVVDNPTDIFMKTCEKSSFLIYLFPEAVGGGAHCCSSDLQTKLGRNDFYPSFTLTLL